MSLIEDNTALPECEERTLYNHYLTFKFSLCDVLPQTRRSFPSGSVCVILQSVQSVMVIQVFPSFFRGFSWRRRRFLGEDNKKCKFFAADLLSHDHICIFCYLRLKNVVFATVRRRRFLGEDNVFRIFVDFLWIFG